MLYKRGYLNKLESSVKIDIINFYNMIETLKVRDINKNIKFYFKDRVVCLNELFDDI